MKKLASVLLAALLTLSFIIPASAAPAHAKAPAKNHVAARDIDPGF